MKLRVVQWNIGGGFVREQDADATDQTSYNKEDLNYVINVLREIDADIVCMEEVHLNKERSQPEEIAEALGYAYFVVDTYAATSHTDPSMQLGQAVLSRYPFNSHEFVKFYYPELTTTKPDGTPWDRHEKGATSVGIDLNGKELVLKACHSHPYEFLGIETGSEEYKKIVASMESVLKLDGEHVLVAGDFNFHDQDLKLALPGLFTDGVKEAVQITPTSPHGKIFDYFVYKGISLIKIEVQENLLTDHYALWADFEIV